MKLTEAEKYHNYIILPIGFSGHGKMTESEERRVREMGILEGEPVYILGRAFGGGIIVRLRGCNAVIRRHFAQWIRVKPV